MSFAHMHANTYANICMNLPNIEIAAIFDENEERAQKMSEKFNADYYLDQEIFLKQDMDAVIICSENIKHKEMVLNAAKAKKHILCEKPISTNVADAEEMIETCRAHDVILQIAFPVRFSSPIQRLKAMIDKGEVGDIIACRTTNRGHNPGSWFVDNELSGGGAVLDHTVHMVDIMRWILNKEVVEVHANVDSYFHDIPSDDAGLLTLEFENGVIASHDASWSKFKEYPTWGDITIEVIGTKKTVKIDALKEHLRFYTDGPKSLKNLFFGNNMNLGLIHDFITCVEKGNTPSITGYDGLKAMEVALKAYESNRDKKAIRL